MAVSELSACRSALLADDTRSVSNGAYGASEEVLIVRQAGAIQGQLESSTEFHSKHGLCRHAQAREKKRPYLPSFGGRLDARRESGAFRTCGRLGDSATSVYVHMNDRV